jgi:hypothetical protein
MSMVPPLLLRKLAQLRRRERLLRFVWGAARVVSLVLVALLLACVIDWTVDLWQDTPYELRVGMLIAQAAVAAVAIFVLIVLPLFKRLRNERLALYVEDRRPELQHRLISALQLNQPHAKTQGMSPELLGAVTHEAMQHVRPIAFASLADHQRLRRAFLVLVPVLLLIAGLAALWPETAWALLQRQALEEVDIPRDIALRSASAEVWPSGEEVVLKFRANGPGVTERSGWATVYGEDGQSFSVPLKLETDQGNDQAIFAARVPPASVNFAYLAKLGDGRTRHASQVRYVARPNVIQQDAYLILPAYVGLRPNKTRYEQMQPGGEVIGIPELPVRVVVKTQKPVVHAVLATFGTPYPDLAAPSGLTKTQDAFNQLLASLTATSISSASPSPLTALAPSAAGLTPVRLRTFQQTLLGSTELQWQFDLRPTETSYRVVVFDEYGFASKTGTVRAIRVEPEPPPVVTLHPEHWDARPAFTSKAKTPQILDFEGMPLPVDEDSRPGPIRISYEAFGPYGVGKAQLKIGVLRGANASEGEGDGKKEKIERWVVLPLAEVQAKRDFDKARGAFKDSPEKEQVPFYAVPSPNPKLLWPRVIAGGRLDYQPSKLLDQDGKPFEFKVDDQIVIYVEVFNQNPDPAKALMARSRFREKDLVTWDRFERWCFDTLQEASRIEALVQMQQQVYDRPWFSIFGFK